MIENIALIYGTRPEFLKVYPIIKAFEQESIPLIIINSGQHDSLLTQMEKEFGVEPHHRLSVQSNDFTNSNLIAKIINTLSDVVHQKKIGKLIAQGDTFTVLAASIVAFMEQKKFYHIEAGLRTSDINLPFPEEYNRRVVSLGTHLNFAPTNWAKDNLLKENVPQKRVQMMGNTIVDTIQFVLKEKNITIQYEDYVFITAHRRENIGKPLEEIAQAIKELAMENPSTTFHWSMHPNPNTRKHILSQFENESPKNMLFSEPLGYFEAIEIMAKSKLLISDSGGIQEEAPSLQKRVLILREETERPEVLQNEVGILVGAHKEKIKKQFYEALNKPPLEKGDNPFGDGKTAHRIVKHIVQ